MTKCYYCLLEYTGKHVDGCPGIPRKPISMDTNVDFELKEWDRDTTTEKRYPVYHLSMDDIDCTD